MFEVIILVLCCLFVLNILSYDEKKDCIVFWKCKFCNKNLTNFLCVSCKKKWFDARLLATNFLFIFFCWSAFYFYDYSKYIVLVLISTIFSAIILFDLYYCIIPDIMHIFLFMANLLYIVLAGKSFLVSISSSVAYCLVGLCLYFVFLYLKKKEGMGFGDIKLMLSVGLLLEISYLPFFFLFSGIFGIVTAVLWKIFFKTNYFPFGPSLILSCVMCLYVSKVDIAYELAEYLFFYL